MLQVWTVRNKAGQFIGSYRVATAKQALDRFFDEQMLQASTFKKSMSCNLRREDFSAAVERREA